MAPAIVHFLVGASFALLLAAPLAYRYDPGPWWPPWLIVVGGLWGLAPDAHHAVARVDAVPGATLRGVHGDPWTDLFALHATLDRPAVRELYVESVLASLLLFVAAVTAFTLAARLGARESRPGVDRRPIVAGLALAGGFGVLLALAIVVG